MAFIRQNTVAKYTANPKLQRITQQYQLKLLPNKHPNFQIYYIPTNIKTLHIIHKTFDECLENIVFYEKSVYCFKNSNNSIKSSSDDHLSDRDFDD